MLVECDVHASYTANNEVDLTLSPLKVRTDKTHPNDARTIAGTIMDCLQPVTLEFMLDCLESKEVNTTTTPPL